MRYALVCGAGGFIGSHMVTRLKREGYYVVGVDLKYPEFSKSKADKFIRGDLRDISTVNILFNQTKYDEVYQFAADMGGANFVFTGDHDSNIMHNSAMINLHIADACVKYGVKKVFYSSSACAYSEINQKDPNNPKCDEASAWPANPDSNYGIEKLFSEQLYLAYAKNNDLEVRIARYHNIFGPEGTWDDDLRSKAPAAFCKKIANCEDGDVIDLIGVEDKKSGKIDGIQTRSFLYINECIEGTRRLMESGFTGPVNIGSEEMISIKDFAEMIINISGKNISINWIKGPCGVMGRNSDNKLIREKLGWAPSERLRDGIEKTYKWIEAEHKLKKYNTPS